MRFGVILGRFLRVWGDLWDLEDIWIFCAEFGGYWGDLEDFGGFRDDLGEFWGNLGLRILRSLGTFGVDFGLILVDFLGIFMVFWGPFLWEFFVGFWENLGGIWEPHPILSCSPRAAPAPSCCSMISPMSPSPLERCPRSGTNPKTIQVIIRDLIQELM